MDLMVLCASACMNVCVCTRVFLGAVCTCFCGCPQVLVFLYIARNGSLLPVPYKVMCELDPSTSQAPIYPRRQNAWQRSLCHLMGVFVRMRGALTEWPKVVMTHSLTKIAMVLEALTAAPLRARSRSA